MNKPVILAAGTPQVLLPYDNATAVRAQPARAPRPAGHLDGLGRAATMKPADVGAAGRHERGRAARGQPHSAAHAGQGRLDPAGAAQQRTCTADVSEQVADNAMMLLAPEAPPLRQACRFKAGKSGERRRRGQALPCQRGAGGAMERVGTERKLRARARPSSSCSRRPPSGKARRRGDGAWRSARPHARAQAAAKRTSSAKRRVPSRRQVWRTPVASQPSAPLQRAGAAALSAGRPARGRWCPGRRTPARCRPARRAPAA